jgi:hypothetical protein
MKCLVSAITQKKDKLQEENILDILQIKQVRNEIYKRTKSERKTLFFRILLLIDLNIIVYDLHLNAHVTQVKLITGMCR